MADGPTRSTGGEEPSDSLQSDTASSSQQYKATDPTPSAAAVEPTDGLVAAAVVSHAASSSQYSPADCALPGPRSAVSSATTAAEEHGAHSAGHCSAATGNSTAVPSESDHSALAAATGGGLKAAPNYAEGSSSWDQPDSGPSAGCHSRPACSWPASGRS